MKLKSPTARRLARARFLSDAVLANAEPWTGPVERRNPATYQRASEILIRRCNRIGCGHWTATRLRCCTICHQVPLE